MIYQAYKSNDAFLQCHADCKPSLNTLKYKKRNIIVSPKRWIQYSCWKILHLHRLTTMHRSIFYCRILYTFIHVVRCCIRNMHDTFILLLEEWWFMRCNLLQKDMKYLSFPPSVSRIYLWLMITKSIKSLFKFWS